MSNQFAGLMCLLLGAASGAYLFWALSKSKRVTKRIVTEGTVLESKLLPFDDSFEPYVKYQYTVRGKNFTNDKLMSFSIVSESKFVAKSYLKPYPVGKIIKVHFDRDNPQDSVLEIRNKTRQHVLWAIFSMAIIFYGIFLLFQK